MLLFLPRSEGCTPDRQVHAHTGAMYFSYFVAMRRVSKSFNKLVEPIAFHHVAIHLLDHFHDIEVLTREPDSLAARKAHIHAGKIRSLASFHDSPPASTSTDGSEEREEESDALYVWRWAKSLAVWQSRPLGHDRDIKSDGRLESLVQAIQGLRFVERVG